MSTSLRSVLGYGRCMEEYQRAQRAVLWRSKDREFLLMMKKRRVSFVLLMIVLVAIIASDVF